MLKTIFCSVLIFIIQFYSFADEIKTTPNAHQKNISRNQAIFFNIGGGFNFAMGDIDGNGYQRKKRGLALHLLVEHQYLFHKYFAYGSDLGFYKKSFKVSKTYNYSELNYEVSLKQLNFAPKLIFIYKYIYFGIGLFLNYNISNSQTTDSTNSFNLSYKVKTFEYGLINVMGFQYIMQNDLIHRFGFRLSYGFNDIYSNHFDDKLNNHSTELEYAIGSRF